MDKINLVMSFVALIIAILTLWLAHLKGPNIKLARPGKPHQCSNGGLDYPKGYKHGDPLPPTFTLQSTMLLFNTGNRPGVLFDLQLTPNDAALISCEIHDRDVSQLPSVLLPGEQWKAEISFKIGTKREHLRKNAARMQTTYSVTSSLGRTITRTEELECSLALLHERLRLRIQEEAIAAGER